MRWLIAVLAFCEAGWLTFDGLHALTTGGYVTPKTGAHTGQLGPWARLLPRVGVDPRSTPVKGGFAAYGIGWLVIVVLYVRTRALMGPLGDAGGCDRLPLVPADRHRPQRRAGRPADCLLIRHPRRVAPMSRAAGPACRPGLRRIDHRTGQM